MAKYTISHECYWMSHCGSVGTEGSGTVELSDEEVKKIVDLIRETGTKDVEEMGLAEVHPEIFEKLDEAQSELAYNVEYNYWVWNGYESRYYECDMNDVMEYCIENHGFTFEYDENEYTDEDGSVDEDAIEDAQLEAFEEWLEDFIYGLDNDAAVDFIVNQLNLEIDCNGIPESYEVAIPVEILEMV